MVTIPEMLLQKAIMWTTNPYRKMVEYDFKIVQGVLISCIGSDNLALGIEQVNEATLIFVKGNY